MLDKRVMSILAVCYWADSAIHVNQVLELEELWKKWETFESQDNCQGILAV